MGRGAEDHLMRLAPTESEQPSPVLPSDATIATFNGLRYNHV